MVLNILEIRWTRFNKIIEIFELIWKNKILNLTLLAFTVYKNYFTKTYLNFTKEDKIEKKKYNEPNLTNGVKYFRNYTKLYEVIKNQIKLLSNKCNKMKCNWIA